MYTAVRAQSTPWLCPATPASHKVRTKPRGEGYARTLHLKACPKLGLGLRQAREHSKDHWDPRGCGVDARQAVGDRLGDVLKVHRRSLDQHANGHNDGEIPEYVTTNELVARVGKLVRPRNLRNAARRDGEGLPTSQLALYSSMDSFGTPSLRNSAMHAFERASTTSLFHMVATIAIRLPRKPSTRTDPKSSNACNKAWPQAKHCTAWPTLTL
jgi:hypothetical protein